MLVLVGHGEGVIHGADEGDGGEVLLELSGGVVGDGDDDVGSAAVGAPEPVVVVSADDGGEVEVLAGAEEVDGCGFAVVVGEEEDAGLIGGGEGLVGGVDESEVLLPAEAVGEELGEDAGGLVFGVAAAEVECGGVAVPGGGAEDGDGHGEEEESGEDEKGLVDGEGEGGGAAAFVGGEAVLPGDGSGGEEDGVDGGEVVVLGVEAEHDRKEDEVSEGDPAHVGEGAGAEEGDDSGDPEEGGEWVEHGDLAEEEGQEAEDDVFVAERSVAEEFQGGPVVVDLPEEVGEGDEDEERDGDGGVTAGEDGSLGSEEESDEECEEEEGHGGLVEQA